jgi:acylphosphatase
MPAVARHVLVSGRVQGVGFRWSTRSKAVELRLACWVANLPDGRVEVWFEGESVAVEAMPAEAHFPPSNASMRASKSRRRFACSSPVAGPA